jgi:hypothetical protein
MSYPEPPQGSQQPPPIPPQDGPYAATPSSFPPQYAPAASPVTPWYLKKWFVVVMLILFFPVGLVLCWLSPETKLVGRIIWSVLWGFFLLMIIAGGGNNSSQGPSVANSAPASQPTTASAAQPASAPAAQPASAPASTAPTAASKPAPAPTKQEPKWNTADLNVVSNGNMPVAVALLRDLSPAALRQEADGTIAPATVNKQPWKYYGKPLKLTGAVGIAQAYPPGSDLGKAMGGEAAEIVMVADDGTIIDFFMMGDTGDVNVNDVARVYGYVVGQAEVTNKMGGQTTQMMMVGKVIQKAP